MTSTAAVAQPATDTAPAAPVRKPYAPVQTTLLDALAPQTPQAAAPQAQAETAPAAKVAEHSTPAAAAAPVAAQQPAEARQPTGRVGGVHAGQHRLLTLLMQRTTRTTPRPQRRKTMPTSRVAINDRYA
ncbi:hypothetical protein [Xanthomonas campestris]|uniref:hypothetical protein n=1 Tax=Xanthomonas campestris TaxID=339 RepID=UPI001E3C0E11|nr:hypothetical protein [Xanthomonas campestris]